MRLPAKFLRDLAGSRAYLRAMKSVPSETAEISSAFAHPEVRARATAGDPPPDRISLRDHIAEVEIGAFQSERGTTQRLSFNVVVEVRPLDGPADDNVDRILSYDRVTEAIAFELTAERLNLLETLAERVALRILREPPALRVFVRVEKLDRGPGALGVEIVRSQADLRVSAGDVPDAELPAPVIVYLSNTAIASPDLSRRIDELASDGIPVILAVGPPDITAPMAAGTEPQRRIHLLSMDQNAWVLAGCDARYVVVDNRTELDWGIRNGQISVWAPSKILLDAVGDVPDGTSHPVQPTLWLAERLDAAAVLVIGETIPDGAGGAVRAATLATKLL